MIKTINKIVYKIIYYERNDTNIRNPYNIINETQNFARNPKNIMKSL